MFIVIDYLGLGHIYKSINPIPFLEGMRAAGIYCNWREQVVRGNRVISPMVNQQGEIVATIMMEKI